MKTHINRSQFNCKSLIILIIVFLSLPDTMLARNPSDPYDAPVDSIVVWFNDYCNQHQQLRALYQVMRNIDWTFEPYHFMEIEPFYDLPEVKDAFVFFVRSISVDKDIRNNCTVFYPEANFGEYEDETKPLDWEGYPINNLALSLYINLGYTQDLHEIATTIFAPDEDTNYSAFLWNHLGSGFFQYLQNQLLTVTDPRVHITIAFDYLMRFENPPSYNANAALAVLHDASISTDRYFRFLVGPTLTHLYTKGYRQVEQDINALVDDSDAEVKLRIRNAIRRAQERRHQMMNFLQDE